MILVKSVNISKAKGTVKLPVSEIFLDTHGVSGDAHSGIWHRQVSLLGIESIEKFGSLTGKNYKPGDFAENITTEGELLYNMQPLDLLSNEQITLEVTQIGKKCHGNNCSIFRETGECIMPSEGIFARVIKGGQLKPGSHLTHSRKMITLAVITLSDSADKGYYADQSGELILNRLEKHFHERSRELKPEKIIIPDEAVKLKNILENYIATGTDLIITTGGTGIGPRDITPETVKPLLDKELPGIMEWIRNKHAEKNPNALLSRSVAGTAGQSTIFTLPGSPRAAGEYLDEIIPLLDHIILMIHGIGH